MSESTILRANTYWLPAVAIIIPAISGPTIRETFIAMAFNAKAGCKESRGTNSGTKAAKMGQRIAKPIPLVKVRNKRTYGFSKPNTKNSINAVALAANHNWVKTKKCLRFRISASAPLGMPRSRTGRLEAVCTKAINVADVVNEVIIHAAATSFIHMQMVAVSQTK